jgi:hypothetical protein
MLLFPILIRGKSCPLPLKVLSLPSFPLDQRLNRLINQLVLALGLPPHVLPADWALLFAEEALREALMAECVPAYCHSTGHYVVEANGTVDVLHLVERILESLVEGQELELFLFNSTFTTVNWFFLDWILVKWDLLIGGFRLWSKHESRSVFISNARSSRLHACNVNAPSLTLGLEVLLRLPLFFLRRTGQLFLLLCPRIHGIPNPTLVILAHLLCKYFIVSSPPWAALLRGEFC